MHDPCAPEAPDERAGGIPPPAPAKAVPHRRDRGRDALARVVLAHLPLAVAVIDADTRLLLWNDQAALLFGVPPLTADTRPGLTEILAGTSSLSQPQRERIIAFSKSHIGAGDRTDPDGCLRLSLGREHRLAIQVHGLGLGRWLLILDDGKVTAAGAPGAPRSGDAWLDALTGLSNRRHFNRKLWEALDDATPASSHAVLLIDLDRFGPVNAAFGHPVGDALLCLVGQRLRRLTRDGDLLARLGGEFAILIPNGDSAEPLAARVVGVLAQPFLVEDRLVSTGASIGIVRFVERGASTDDLMRQAELALYEAKSAGGGGWRRFDSATADELSARRSLETELRKALAMGELSLVYQPCADQSSGTLTGFEGRLQWDHPVRGSVPDTEFMPLAEGSRCISALDDLKLRTACADAATWPVPLRVGVIVSSRQLQDCDHLLATLKDALEASGLPPCRLELRILEAAIAGHEARVLQILHRLKVLGLRIGLVDLCLGAASLDRLRSFPFNAVMLRKASFPGITAEADDAAVLRGLANAGMEHIGCYSSSSLTPASGIAAVLRHHASAGRLTSTAE